MSLEFGQKIKANLQDANAAESGKPHISVERISCNTHLNEIGC